MKPELKQLIHKLKDFKFSTSQYRDKYIFHCKFRTEPLTNKEISAIVSEDTRQLFAEAVLEDSVEDLIHDVLQELAIKKKPTFKNIELHEIKGTYKLEYTYTMDIAYDNR